MSESATAQLTSLPDRAPKPPANGAAPGAAQTEAPKVDPKAAPPAPAADPKQLEELAKQTRLARLEKLRIENRLKAATEKEQANEAKLKELQDNLAKAGKWDK